MSSTSSSAAITVAAECSPCCALVRDVSVLSQRDLQQNSIAIPGEQVKTSSTRNPGISKLLDAGIQRHDGKGDHRILERISETGHQIVK